MVLQGKAGVKTLDTKVIKDITKPSDKLFSQLVKPTALRPSQKNLQAPVKQAPSIHVESTNASVNPEPAFEEAEAEIINIRKGAAKRQTTIFREDSADVQSAKQGLSETSVETRPRAATTTDPAPVHQSLPPRREKSEPSIVSEPKEDRFQESGPSIEEQGQQSNIESLLPLLHDDDSNQALHQQRPHTSDQSHMPMPYSTMHLGPIANMPVGFPNYSVVQLPGQSHPVMVSFDGAQTGQYDYADASRMMPLPAGLPTPEPEEYWDEEEEEEYYEVDGYTTTRSLRSRGDNTQGGTTVVMNPKTTIRAERELAAAKQFVESNKVPEDVEDEAWDTSMVAEYGDEIFAYMKQLEDRMLPNPHYMDNQTEVQWSMRSVLMDWLVQVHNRFTLLPETLFLAVNYVDRFLSSKIVSLGKLQLVGATAIFVAAKYEEINCPSVQEIVYMVDGGYTVDEILKAERFMLSMLQFELGWPGPMSFLRRISKADDYDLETRTLAKYFLEITVMDERFVGCTPSFTAAGAHCLARFLLRKGDWVCVT